MDNFYLDLEDSLDDVKFNGFIIDPKAAYRESRHDGFKQTLLDEDEIKTLGQMALRVYTEYVQSELEPQGMLEKISNIDMKELEKKVLENHKIRDTLPIFGEHTQLQAIVPRRQLKIMKKEMEQQQKELKLAQESLRLRKSERLSCSQIMKRLGISYYKLRRYLNNPIKKAPFWNLKNISRGKYKKLHSRARTHIVNMLTYDQVPIQISDIQKSLQQKVQLHCNKQMIRRQLKNELMMTYKQVKQITNLHNNNSSKLQRQFAAQQFVIFLNEGKRIINIDESVLHQTDERRRGWTAPYIKNRVTNSQRLNQMNLIIGVSSTGELFYTVNRGRTNQHSFIYLLCKLVLTLDQIDLQWRKNTVIMIDNAPYHRSHNVMAQYGQLKLPLLFLGPYHYKLAPAELMYSWIKNRDLNPLNTRAQSKGYWAGFMKELGMNISRINQNLVRRCFYHVLTAALESISLKNL